MALPLVAPPGFLLGWKSIRGDAHPSGKKSRVAEAFAGLEAGAVGEFGGGDLFAPLEFDGLQAQESCVAARDEPIVLCTKESAGNGTRGGQGWVGAHCREKRSFSWRLAIEVEGQAKQGRVRTGQGREGAHA